MKNAELNEKIKRAYENAVPVALKSVLSNSVQENGQSASAWPDANTAAPKSGAGMEVKLKNHADALIFQPAICAGASQIAPAGGRKSEICAAPSRKRSGMEVIMGENRKKGRWIKAAAAAAACVVVIGGSAFGLRTYQMNYAVASKVSLDVNPSIQIMVNEKERVLDVEALNQDGETVIGDMDLKGSDIDVAVNALIGSMLKNGYLSDIANSILISVDNDDPVKSAALQERLTKKVNEMLQTDDFSGAVLSQIVSEDGDLQKLADQYGITLGKAQLIQEILANSQNHTFEELAPLSINELNLILESADEPLQNKAVSTKISSVGSASDKAYIGVEKAKAAAFAHAGISEQDAGYVETDMDTERGVMVYEIDFKAGGYEYEYEIDALTGEVIKNQKERDDDYMAAGNTGALQAAQQNGDRTPSDGAGNGSAENAGNIPDTKGSGTGEISDTNGSGSGAAGISAEKAKEIALNHAGVSADAASFQKAKLDRDDGILQYEIEFRSGNMEYEYEIDAVSGAVLDYDVEVDD